MNDLAPESFAQCPLPIAIDDRVLLGHGAGGQMMDELIGNLFLWAFDDPVLRAREDSAVLQVGGTTLAFSTDSFVVDPIFFPGGDIGDLAVNGTVNDLAMSGARPLFLSVAMILEEGFPLADLKRVVLSMRRAAQVAKVRIVTGDTKVVNKGKGDKLFINTTGVGIFDHLLRPASHKLAVGDHILVSGDIAAHGMTILSQREGLDFQMPIESDTAALHELAAAILAEGGEAVHAMRDATRGGLAAVLNEFAVSSGTCIELREEAIPIAAPVAAACEFLGLDPLHVANEGKMVVAVAPERAESVLATLRRHPLGAGAKDIGIVSGTGTARVFLETRLGSHRVVDRLVGEQLPRIC